MIDFNKKSIQQPIYNFKSYLFFCFLILGFTCTSLTNINAQCKSRPSSMACGNFRTQTQGGWGSTPRGNNPGAYLQRYFEAAFPNGLTIGCTNKLVLTTSRAVSDFLPSGGTASKLPTGTKTNPGSRYGNVFAGQVVALKLSVVFDGFDANFSGSDVALKDLVVKSGSFAGVTVGQILAEGEKAIGGCGSLYSICDLNNVISRINENFVDGTNNLGFLTCPQTSNPCANDTDAPIFATVPQSFEIGIDVACYTADWALPTVSDNCTNNITLTSNINIGDCLPEGVHTVTYTARDAAGNTSTASFTVTVFLNDLGAPLMGTNNQTAEIARSSAQDVDNQSNNINVNFAKKDKTVDIKVFPNPASQFVNVDLTSYNDNRIEVVLYNTVGVAVRRLTVESGSQSLLQMPLFDLPNGQYIISVAPEKQTTVVKRIVVAN